MSWDIGIAFESNSPSGCYEFRGEGDYLGLRSTVYPIHELLTQKGIAEDASAGICWWLADVLRSGYQSVYRITLAELEEKIAGRVDLDDGQLQRMVKEMQLLRDLEREQWRHDPEYFDDLTKFPVRMYCWTDF